MSVMKRSLGGMITGAGSVVLRTLLNLLLIPVLISHLGVPVFGLYLLLVSLLELAGMVDLGLTAALVTLLGGESVDHPERPAHLAAGNLLFTLLGVLFLGLGFLFAPYFAHTFNISPESQENARLCYLLMVPEAALMIYTCYGRSVLLAHSAHQWTNVADTASSVISSVGGFWALLSGYDLTGVMVARLVAAIVRLAIITINLAYLEKPALVAGFNCSRAALKQMFSGGVFKRLFHIGGHAMMLNVSIILSHKIDDVVIARFLPISFIGIYEIVFRLLGITIQVGLKLSEGAYPLFARMKSEKNKESARELFLRLSSFLNLMAAMIMLTIISHYDVLLNVMSHKSITPAETMPILMVAVPCLLSGVLQMPANAWLFTWGYHKFLTISSFKPDFKCGSGSALWCRGCCSGYLGSTSDSASVWPDS
jgi:O-antigen/teichoic acid export membrane protein